MGFPIDVALERLEKEVVKYDVPVVDLIRVQTDDPFRILVATMLSARTKDEVTAVVCERLFKRAHTPQGILKIKDEELKQLIFGVGFYKTKAKHLHELCKKLIDDFDGKVPHSIDELLTLPGVGRKTANLVVALTETEPGICVDTHVHRICNRWDYVRTSSPQETEMRLRKKLPKKYWGVINRVLVAFGQHLCKPISPYCSRCPVSDLCPRKGVKSSR